MVGLFAWTSLPHVPTTVIRHAVVVVVGASVAVEDSTAADVVEVAAVEDLTVEAVGVVEEAQRIVVASVTSKVRR